MSHDPARFPISRRRFAFWVGLGLFNLGEVLGSDRFDRLAAAGMRAAEPDSTRTTPEHWTAAENNTWLWFERENLVDGHWKLTGITRPVRRDTGELAAADSRYLEDRLVPETVRNGSQSIEDVSEGSAVEEDAGQASSRRRTRHGRPPSRWLRSLRAEELRIWLKKIDVPEAGVMGMTFWEHLTRDHSFHPDRIAGLTEDEQAKLHAAAHYGY